MNATFRDYNIIPIGDHCSISSILKELKLRTTSYPFDWVARIDQLYDTNIFYNMELIRELNETNVNEIVNKYIGNALTTSNNLNQLTKTWFPHESKELKDMDNTFAKYIRRFTRLYTDIRTKKNIFILLTRCYFIDEPTFNTIMNTLFSFNSENMILFISGSDHPYFSNTSYKNVIFKHIHYEIRRAFNYDNEVFRPLIKEYFKDLLL